MVYQVNGLVRRKVNNLLFWFRSLEKLPWYHKLWDPRVDVPLSLLISIVVPVVIISYCLHGRYYGQRSFLLQIEVQE